MTKPFVLKRNGSAKERDELGRKCCSRRDKCQNPDGPWLPEAEFFRGQGSDGLRPHCRTCSNFLKARRPKKSHHKTREGRPDSRPRMVDGSYVCIKGPWEWRGRDKWFSQTEMAEMLKWAYWEPGMVFQQMTGGRVTKTVKVIGEQNFTDGPPRDRQILERTE